MIIVPVETYRMTSQRDMAKSTGGIFQLLFENAPQKTKEIERNSKCSSVEIFATTSPFISVADILWRLHIHVVTSFICYKYIMSSDSVIFYQVLRRITIKNRSGIQGILHDISFNIVLSHLIPRPLNILAMPWREYFIKCRVMTYFGLAGKECTSSILIKQRCSMRI